MSNYTNLNDGIDLARHFYNECTELNLDKKDKTPYKYLGQTLRTLDELLKQLPTREPGDKDPG